MFRIVEEAIHQVAYAAEIEVSDLGLQLNDTSQDRHYILPLIQLHQGLKFIKDHGQRPPPPLFPDRLEDPFQRSRRQLGRLGQIDRKGRLPRLRIDRYLRAQMPESAENPLQGHASTTLINQESFRNRLRQVAHAAPAPTVHQHAPRLSLQPDRLQHRRGLAHPTSTTNYAILLRSEMPAQFPQEFRTGAEILAGNDHAMLKWIHYAKSVMLVA